MPWSRTMVPADAARLPVDGWSPVDVDGRSILLVPVDGSWFAIEDRCSHAGCAFSEDGELDAATVICGCHGSEFDVRTGEVLRGPAERPIATFATRVFDGIVEVAR